VKIILVLLHLLAKASPLLRHIDFSDLFLPLKVVAVYALTLRDLLGVSVAQNIVSDVVILTTAAALTGLMLWPKPVVPSGAK
jgi:hypothetical protein